MAASMTIPDRDLPAIESHLNGGPPPVLTAPKKRKNEEFVLQCQLIRWWSSYCKTVGVPEFLLWHTPNSAVYGGPQEAREKMGAMLNRMGQRSGVPDVALMYPRESVFPLESCHGLFLELKSPKGIVSPEQKTILAELERQGYRTAICRTLEDAKRVIQDYLQ